jgi:uncharacterized damage-inducible protein DinB
MARLLREPATLGVWPDLDLDACGARLDELSRRWPEYLHAHSESLDDRIGYTNSQGENWTNTVEEILTHVVIHSAYHRGQIASDLRAAGSVPVNTDYIHAVRQGHIQ